MRNKAVFLDRDGTINVEKDYLFEIEKFEFLPGVIDGLKRFQDADYLLIVITNQSGIARGYYTENDYNRLTKWMTDTLAAKGVNITDTLYCPHLPNATDERYRVECNCRKPKTGLFYQAIAKYEIDLSKSIAIGDKIRDLAICETVDGENCQGFLVYADTEKTEVNIRYICGGISEVANRVLGI